DPPGQALLGEPHSVLRAQAAEWAAARASPTVISVMLALLADPATQARFVVQNALLRMGTVVAAPLGDFLDIQSGRAAEAGLRVAETMAGPRFAAAGGR